MDLSNQCQQPTPEQKLHKVDSLGFSISEEAAGNDDDSVVDATPLPQLVVSDRIRERMKVMSLRVQQVSN